MASYLRPRRGKKATAESQAIVLKRGEVFFECPDEGVGTGLGKIKVGDGATAYASLPYFLKNFSLNDSDATIAFTDTSTATDASNNATYLTNIKPANSIKTIFTNLKQLLFNYNSEITQLNNDLSDLGVYNVAVTINTRMSSYESAGSVQGIINTSLASNYTPYIVAENNNTGYKTVMPFVDISSARCRFGNVQTETSGTFAIFKNSKPSFIFRNVRTADENVQTLSDYTIKLYART